MLNILTYFLKKDIKSRYIGSGLGLLWVFLLPLFQIFLFWFVFAQIMKARPYAEMQIPYIYFLLSSFFFWLAFSESLIRSSYSILENAEMVKKVSFPNIVLPITVTLSTYTHHIIGFFIFIVLYILTISVHSVFLVIIPVFVMQIIFSIGLGLILSSLMPYFRDLSHILGPIIQGLFFLSPIMYSTELIPEKFRFLIFLNPFTYFATSYQGIILLKKIPPFSHLIVITLLSFLTLIVGVYVFKKLKEGFADVL
jgi:ABC-type polysaccharide/polyol phosphate export permease